MIRPGSEFALGVDDVLAAEQLGDVPGESLPPPAFLRSTRKPGASASRSIAATVCTTFFSVAAGWLLIPK